MLAGMILGPLVAVALLLVFHDIREWQAEQALRTRLSAVVAQPEQYSTRIISSDPVVRLAGDVRLEQEGEALLRMPDGVHEYETDNRALLVALTTTPRGRYAVAQDISVIERGEQFAFVAAPAGSVIAVIAALVLGFRISRRYLLPLENLAHQVSEGRDGELDASRQDSNYGEIAELATALTHYRDRMSAALARERAFSADVSHELRTPIAIIQNAAEILEESPDRSLGEQKALARIRHAATRMQETVGAMLLLVRERTPDDPEDSVSVADCVDNVLRYPEIAAAAQSIPIAWRRDANPFVDMPAAVVEVIVVNVVRNALQHSQGTWVSVRLCSDRLIVADDGVGMKPVDVTQAERSGATGENSLGLGLSLVDRLATRFGGSLSFYSGNGAASSCWTMQTQAGSGNDVAGPVHETGGPATNADSKERSDAPLHGTRVEWQFAPVVHSHPPGKR
ncbi:HAMP domain-containing sensor histidine kinase [Aquisalimonas lutea]|uniref:sensor histidine kinase n=1 Tax=Aquisalimonas lutea TaxID=1327750 RepID=UPI0025B31B30|nr:HAMP domain-containing sensor histidine kinase [Aquisalimonas lutea]MDN3518517.1 HAMP domain-containing sensor histidine kinase [Aquisalimonas lutea]